MQKFGNPFGLLFITEMITKAQMSRMRIITGLNIFILKYLNAFFNPGPGDSLCMLVFIPTN